MEAPHPPAIALYTWHGIPEILHRLFRIFLDANDIWSLTACANVCRAWRRSGVVLATRFSSPLLTMDRKLIAKLRELGKKKVLSGDKSNHFQELPLPPPFQGTDEADFCNRRLGPLLGRGSFARVYALNGIAPWCIKIATGGLSSSDRWTKYNEADINKVLQAQEHVSGLRFFWYSSGTAAALLSHTEVGVVLGGEFQRLQTIASYALPPNGTPLYPIPYLFGVMGLTGYYVMERLFGPTVRTLLKSAVRGERPVGDYTQVDFHPLVVRLVQEMEWQLANNQCWHGDMKPENIILVWEGSTWRLRLIDPVPQSITDRYNSGQIITLPYNPGAYLDWRSDLASLVLLLYEIKTGDRPFTHLGALNYDALTHDVLRAALAELKNCMANVVPAVSTMADGLFTPGNRHDATTRRGPQCLRLVSRSILTDGCKFDLQQLWIPNSALAPALAKRDS